jgi:hypothetical protein
MRQASTEYPTLRECLQLRLQHQYCARRPHEGLETGLGLVAAECSGASADTLPMIEDEEQLCLGFDVWRHKRQDDSAGKPIARDRTQALGRCSWPSRLTERIERTQGNTIRLAARSPRERRLRS